ncbi:MAG: leucine-rich repeat protein [Clostridia bacterium]|nr:leucine-rich repeat protein [Clostridia bacterium]
MRKLRTRIALLISLLMLAALLPTGIVASAEEGTCGENLTWAMDDDGALIISGAGEMSDFMFRGPWGYAPKTVVIEEGVTSIGKNAFDTSWAMTSISIPSTVTSVGENAFYKCYSLETITVASGSKYYHEKDGCLIETKTGRLLTGAQGFKIPDDGSVTSIANDAFAYFEWLTDPSLPDSITSIGEDAFDRTGYAKNDDNWEDGALYLGKWLIDTDSSYLSKQYEVKPGTVGLASKALIYYRGTQIVLPAGLKYICAYALEGAKLTSLELPESVEVIEMWAFGYSNQFPSVSFGSNVKIIDEYAFYGCNALSSITFSEGLKFIGQDAFYTSGSYGKPTIPFSVEFIGKNAFNSGVTLRVYEYSYALRYATENEINYELLPHDPPAIAKGDMDGDGEITVADALKALRIAAKLVEPTEQDIAIGDTDGDGEITVADALKILRVAAKLIDKI